MQDRDQLIKQAAELFQISAPLIVACGISGIVIITGLMWALRRYLKEQRDLEERRNARAAAATPHIDAWQSAAERYEDPEAATEPGAPFTDDEEDENDETWGTGEDGGFDDNDDDDGGGEPWR